MRQTHVYVVYRIIDGFSRKMSSWHARGTSDIEVYLEKRILSFPNYIIHYMASTNHALRPAKRRKTKKHDALRENDVEALAEVTVERVIVESSSGPVERKKLVPIPKSTTSTDVQDSLPEKTPERHTYDEYNNEDYGDSAVPAVPQEIRNVRTNI